jgi:hypothetical protein
MDEEGVGVGASLPLLFIRVGAEENDYDLDNETEKRGEST